MLLANARYAAPKDSVLANATPLGVTSLVIVGIRGLT